MFDRIREAFTDDSVTQQPKPEVDDEPKPSLLTVNFRRLEDLERDTNQCGVIIPNQMQCPQRAYIQILDEPVIYLCAFHAANNFSIAPFEHKQYIESKKD